MEVTIYQRIMLILDDKQVSVNALSKLVGMSQTTLNTQLKGERALSANVVAKVLSVFPDVSAERYGCCRETIFNALAFRSQSKQSEDIRQAALNEFGGVETDKVLFY